MTWRYSIIEADVADAMPQFEAQSFDAMLSDVPYGLGTREPTPAELVAYILGDAGLDMGGDFMAKEWQIPPVAVWRQIRRVLRPGAPVFIFAGTRTQDLISIGMRAAGIEIRDAIDWIYAQGWAKGGDVGKKLDKAVGAERKIIGEKTSPDGVSYAKRHGARSGRVQGLMGEPTPVARESELETEPATTIEEWSCEPGCPVAEMDRQSGDRPGMSGGGKHRADYAGGMFGSIDSTETARGDHGGASRFFATFQATEEDRWVPHAGAASTTDESTCAGRRTESRSDNSPTDGCGSRPMVRSPRAGRCTTRIDTLSITRSTTSSASAPKPMTISTSESAKHTESSTASSNANASGAETGSRSRSSRRARPEPTKATASPADASICANGALETGNTPASTCEPGAQRTRTTCGTGAGAIEPQPLDRPRFFFCGKVTPAERYFGCEHLPPICPECKRFTTPEVRKVERLVKGKQELVNRPFCPDCDKEMVPPSHPTAKPVKMLKMLAWLAAMMLPPPREDGRPRRILIPYSGSGSEMIAALRAGWDEVVGIQRSTKDDEERSYVMIARARLARWADVPMGMDEAEAISVGRKAEKGNIGQGSLFAQEGT